MVLLVLMVLWVRGVVGSSTCRLAAGG
eukprot:COSAG01_NODE_74598_length_207_cov_26.166667_2_plen_26_part_01